MPEMRDLPREMRLATYGPGSFLGEDDVVYRNVYTGTLRCNSQRGVLLKVLRTPEEFYMWGLN
jgi:hypothetical protein